MTETGDPTRCSRCGTEYPGEASPLGLCPACLLALGEESGVRNIQESGVRNIQESGVRNQESGGSSVEESGGIRQQESEAQSPVMRERVHARRRRWLTIPAIGLVLAVAMLIAFMRVPRRNTVTPLAATVRFTLPYPAGTESIDGAQFAVSPDSTSVVVAARSADGSTALWLRRLQALDWQELSGTNGALYPFWSPDSRHVGFFAERRLKRIDVGNGLTQIVCDAPDGRGGAWGAHGEIVFAPDASGPLVRVAASGGAIQPITNGQTAHLWPHFIDDRHLVFFANAADDPSRGNFLLDLGTGAQTLVAQRVVAAVPAGGVLLYAHNGTLVAQRIDAPQSEQGPELRTIAGADDIGGPMSIGPNHAATPTVLVYRRVQPKLTELLWFDRSGRAIGAEGQPADYRGAAISPDGRTVVVARSDERRNVSNLWRIDLARSATSRLTFGSDRDLYPVWSPDATRVAFVSR